jgi:hypothetical protein
MTNVFERTQSSVTLQAEPKRYPELGVLIPRTYLPRAGVDLVRWSVIACDQYTSQPEYWGQVESIVGDAPSTLRLTFPEVYLGKPGEPERIASIQECMRTYLAQEILEPQEGLIYVERTVEGRTRRGLVLALDLERYDYNKGAHSLIRATEGTIVDRLPPRMKIRVGAQLELPHILVLIDDPQRTVIESVGARTGDPDKLVKVYDFDLMMDSGHLAGYRVADPDLENQVIAALGALADPQNFRQKYGLEGDESVLLFAMGDGNHSLATAKAVWENMKSEVGMDHPARFALVEIENVHDEGLVFEPIHRLLFGVKGDIRQALSAYFDGKLRFTPCPDCLEMERIIATQQDKVQSFGLVIEHEATLVEIDHPTSNLCVGTLQAFLDDFLQRGGAARIDYLHGKCVLCKLTSQPDSAGFYLPNMEKSELFRTVILDGALPRKTFSLGEAREKRFYMESRRIA